MGDGTETKERVRRAAEIHSGTKERKVEKAEGKGSCKVCCSNCKQKN